MSRRQGHRRAARGAALITALLLAALAAVMVSGMLWRQWAAIRREQTMRDAEQAQWLLRGATDWARVILTESVRMGGSTTSLDQPWAVPLAESSLARFLGAGNDDALLSQAWIEGHIVDAQSRFNLANLAPNGQPSTAAMDIMRRVCTLAGVSPGLTEPIAGAIAAAAVDRPGAALPLRSLSDLARVSPAVAAALPALASYVTLLPQTTPVNINTASAAVLRAVLDLPPDKAQFLTQARTQVRLGSSVDGVKLLSELLGPNPPPRDQYATLSNYFEVTAQVRIGHLEFARRALVRRVGTLTSIVRVQAVPPWLAAAPRQP